jgi:predicted transcriptional regulator
MLVHENLNAAISVSASEKGDAAMLVKEAMSSKIETVTPDTTLRECARKMDQTATGVLPVWQDGKVIGLVTDRDICCRAVAAGKDPATTKARAVMSTEVASCLENQDCADAVRVMEVKHVRRLMVMNRDHAVVGVLSVDDLARYSHDLAGRVLEAAAPWSH